VADVDSLTLMMAIQAVRDQIERFETLLTSETLRDPEKIQSLIFTYEKAARRLKEAYEKDWSEGSNLPPYSDLVPSGDQSIGRQTATPPRSGSSNRSPSA
jgi:hypothetical protein